MEKPALNQYDIHPLIKRRWSPRSFEDKPVENEKLQRVFEAARWAPSAYNMQPWSYIIGKKGTSSYDNIMNTLIEFNQSWTKFAPVLVLVIGKEIDAKDKPNDTFKYDTGQSVAYLTFQAMHEGLFMHQMSGFSKTKAIENFSIENNYQPIAVFALGYVSSPDQLPEKLQEMERSERSRKSFEDFVFEERFNKKSDVF